MPEEVQDLILLHGSAFTKEDWKTSGILQDLCSRSRNIRVTAVDLPVTATHKDLIQLLMVSTNEQLISLPVTLVTPSASGKAITDWISSGDIDNENKLPNFVSLWIPVACGSIDNVSDTQLLKLKDLTSTSAEATGRRFQIFAIYGDQDLKGKKTSERLRNLIGADILELPGRHPVYLDSPSDFVTSVIRSITR
jgi:hypothetical protein